MPIETLAVQSTDTTWTLDAGATRTIAIAAPDDADTTSISAPAASNPVANYTVSNPVVITGSDTINSVTVRCRCRTIAATNSTGNVEMSDNAWTNKQTRTVVTTTAFADDVGLTNTVKPSGGAWTLATVQSLVLRTMGDDFQVLRITTLTVDVNYTVGSGSGGRRLPLLGVG